MTTPRLSPLEHEHTFGQEQVRPGERRTIVVIVITAVMMVVEIVAGLAFGSMALLADGLHMASHATALAITAFAYIYARRHAADPRYTFGTGKVNPLGGFTGAVLLAVFAVMMVYESVHRLIRPVEIQFDSAIAVAVIGLLVNGVCAVILGGHGHRHQGASDENGGDHDHDDHNLRAAYFHVIADALTSVLAIGALLSGKYFGWGWMDPVMGIVGAMLITQWSIGLIRTTGAVLLDRQAPPRVVQRVRKSLEKDGDRVTDLHVWSIGPGIYAAEAALVATQPAEPGEYKRRVPPEAGIVHITVEVHRAGEGV